MEKCGCNNVKIGLEKNRSISRALEKRGVGFDQHLSEPGKDWVLTEANGVIVRQTLLAVPRRFEYLIAHLLVSQITDSIIQEG